jgi:hypothetical protein
MHTTAGPTPKASGLTAKPSQDMSAYAGNQDWKSERRSALFHWQFSSDISEKTVWLSARKFSDSRRHCDRWRENDRSND